MKFKSGGFLYKEEYCSKKQEEILTEITSNAHEFLHENVEIENISVRDIYLLIKKNKVLQNIFSRNFIKEYISYIDSDKVKNAKPKEINKENPESEIEFIEVYRVAYFDDELNRLEFDNIPHVHGLSHILKKEYDGFAPGKRINWSLSFVPIEHLLDVKIKFNSLITCQQENNINHYNFSKPLIFERENFTLYELLNAITWEISFHGNPEESAEAGEHLKEIIIDVEQDLKDIKEGILESQDVFHSLDTLFARNQFIEGFAFIDDCINKKLLDQLMHYLPNKIDVAAFFSLVFKDKIRLNEKYVGLNAYEFRHKMFKADDTLILSQEMKKFIENEQAISSFKAHVVENCFFDIVTQLGGTIDKEQLFSLEVF